MKNKKNISFIILCLLFLNGCVQSTALLGPAITAGTTGNIYHAGFSYGSNIFIEQETGKTTVEHMSNLLEKKDMDKKINDDLFTLVENQIIKTRKILLTKNNQ